MTKLVKMIALLAVIVWALAGCGGDTTVTPRTAASIAVIDSVAPTNDHQVPFGNVQQGTSSDQTVTVMNTSETDDLVIGTVASANPLAAPFSITADTCSGQTLAPSGICAVALRFAPIGTGPFTDSFDIPSDDAGAPTITISASGTGTAIPVPNITVTDSVNPNDDLQVFFGNVTQGNTSDQTVTVTNTGTANLVIGTVASANPLAAPFSITADYCSGQTITPAGTCTVMLRFAPSSVNSFSDDFDITSDDPDTPTVTVIVAGTGDPVPAPNIFVTDSVNPNNDYQIPFGSVTQGGSADQTVTVTNTGNADLVIGTVAGTNPLAAPFSITADTCSGQIISPSETCTVTVRFAPTDVSAYSDSFDILSNDSDTSSVVFSVSGTGVVVIGAPADLPETGQANCYDEAGSSIPCAGTGQDGELLKGVAWPSPRFTMGTGGEQDCITDNLTGLMWSKNGNLPLASKTWQQALDYVAAINSGTGLCSHKDWRLPNKLELRSLAHYGQANAAAWLNNAAQGFTNVSNFYWSSTTYIYNATSFTNYAWSFDMSSAYLTLGQKGSLYGVWPVRAGSDASPAPVPRTGQTTCYDAAGVLIACAGTGQDGEFQNGVVWPATRFTTNADTTVTDNLTGLTWTPAANTPAIIGAPMCSAGAKLWSSALYYIDCLNANSYLGHNDWRMPNIHELQSLSHDGTENITGYWLQTQGFSDLQANYWSSDSHPALPSYGWVVNIVSGTAGALKDSYSYYVWPVRGGL